MTLKESLLNFSTQLAWRSEIQDKGNYQVRKNIIVVGMGGSHLAADIMKSIRPEKNIIIREDYGLPDMSEADITETSFIFSSYSGNTEEVLDAFHKALDKNLNLIVIASGGELISVAKEKKLPRVELPENGMAPRFALGYSFKAFAAAMEDQIMIDEATLIAGKLKPDELEAKGREIADFLKNRIPVIYSSRINKVVANNWKINFNEGAKTPAFYNFFPELNHNEMDGWCGSDNARKIANNFGFVFIRDSEDAERIKKRMDITKELYAEHGMAVVDFEMSGELRLEKIFSAILVSDWTASFLAEEYGVLPESAEIVEKFKERMKK